jgi:hypothetical protein
MAVLAEALLVDVETLFAEALLPEAFEFVEKRAFKLLIPFK